MATPPATMAEALARLWARFLPEIDLRVSLLEGAAKALAAGSLPDAQRAEAHAAAHKLAGTLGTFGLPEGTELARKAETLLAQAVPAEAASTLRAWAAELREIISKR